MNKLVKLSLALIISVFGIAETNAQWNKKVSGNGNVTTKSIVTQSYDKIKAVGPLDIHLVQGTEGKISVTAESNFHEYIIVEVKDDILVLRIKKSVNLKTNKGIHITVPFEAISGLSLVGSGDVDTKDTIKSDFFDVVVTGSGDVDLAVESNTIDAKITGSGDMILSGSVKDLEVKLSGSGDFDGRSLASENTQAYVSGSGDIEVTASKRIKARVNGSGDITYYGNPDTSDTKVMGSGSISSN